MFDRSIGLSISVMHTALPHTATPEPDTATVTPAPTATTFSTRVGDRYLSRSGTIWTVHAITRAGNRVVLVHPGKDGAAGAVMHPDALTRMIPIT
jgi:hypothetical protein